MVRSGFYEPLPAVVGGSWTTKQAVPLCRKTLKNTPKKGALQLKTCAILELGREQPNRNTVHLVSVDRSSGRDTGRTLSTQPEIELSKADSLTGRSRWERSAPCAILWLIYEKHTTGTVLC